MRKSIKYRIKEDVFIPAGTTVDITPAGIRKHYAVEHASVLLSPDKDSYAEWIMDLEEAIRTGIVEEYD